MRTGFPLLFVAFESVTVTLYDALGIIATTKDELTQLFCKQTEFYRRGGRTQLSASEIAEFDKRRQRIRALFAELEQWNPSKLV